MNSVDGEPTQNNANSQHEINKFNSDALKQKSHFLHKSLYNMARFILRNPESIGRIYTPEQCDAILAKHPQANLVPSFTAEQVETAAYTVVCAHDKLPNTNLERPGNLSNAIYIVYLFMDHRKNQASKQR